MDITIFVFLLLVIFWCGGVLCSEIIMWLPNFEQPKTIIFLLEISISSGSDVIQ